MQPNQSILDFLVSGQQQLAPQVAYNPMAYQQQQQQQQQQQHNSQQPYYPQHLHQQQQHYLYQQPNPYNPPMSTTPYTYSQNMYGQQSQAGFMHPQMMNMMQPNPSQPSASYEHTQILESVLSRKDERGKTPARNACPIHPVINSKSCRTCKKIAAEGDASTTTTKQDEDADEDLIEVIPTGERGEANTANMWEEDIQSNLNSKLKTNILACNYFRVDLFCLKTYHEVIDEIQKHVNHAEPYAIGSSGVPSTLFCCLYKFMLMKLTIKQVRGLLESKQSPMVRALGFLYVRFCSDPKYMYAWFKKYLLDDEVFKPGFDKNSPTMMFGDYVEKLLSDQEYYGTRLPRIPIKYETKIKAKLILNSEKRDRLKKNLSNINKFIKNSSVVAISGQDGDWHEGVLEKVEGRFAQIRFLPDAKTGFEGQNELVNFGEIELADHENDEEKVEETTVANSTADSVQSSVTGTAASKAARSPSSSPQERRKRSRSPHKKRRSSRSQEKRRRSRSRSNERWTKKRQSSRSRSPTSRRSGRRSRSNSPVGEKKAKSSKIESIKEREARLIEEIKKRNSEQAVASNKNDVARVPQSYKTALSGHASRLAGGGRSPSNGRKEEFVETSIPSVMEHRQKKNQSEVEKPATKEKTREQIEKEKKIMQMYGGDIQTKGSAYTSNRQASDYA